MWDLSKILNCRSFRPKILHRQFHLISTVLVIKTQKMSENGEIYTAGKKFTLPLAVTALTNSTSASISSWPSSCSTSWSAPLTACRVQGHERSQQVYLKSPQVSCEMNKVSKVVGTLAVLWLYRIRLSSIAPVQFSEKVLHPVVRLLNKRLIP